MSMMLTTKPKILKKMPESRTPILRMAAQSTVIAYVFVFSLKAIVSYNYDTNEKS